MAKECKSSDTKANSCQYNWTTNPTSQYNPNLHNRVEWRDLAKAVGYTNGTFATALYHKYVKATHYSEKKVKDKDGKQVTKKLADKWTTVYEKPFPLAFSDFEFEIPSNATIYQIKFNVWMKVDPNIDVLAPVGNFRIGRSGNFVDIPKGAKTGFNDGTYLVVPSQKLTKDTTVVTYVMDKSDWDKSGFTISQLNGNRFGLDLLCHDAEFPNAKTKDSNGKIYVEKIRCTIEYDVPKPSVNFTNPVAESYKTFNYAVDFDGTESSPYTVSGGNEFPLTLHYRNRALSKISSRSIQVNVPWGSTIVSATPSSGSYSNGIWTLSDSARANETLELILKGDVRGLSNISAYVRENQKTIASDKYYYYVNATTSSQYDILIFPLREFRKYTKSCADIHIRGVSTSTSLSVIISNSQNVDTPSVEVVNGEDVTINNIVDGGNQITVELTVPDDEVDFTLRYCCYPKSTGDMQIVCDADSFGTANAIFNVIASYEYLLDLTDNHHQIFLNSHRIASDVGTDSTIIPCVFDEVDSSMIMTDCQIGMSIWEELDYIGCIPLEQTHFEPKSTFKDTLLNQTYKNKRYMGKKLATDEDITLNVRLHPQQVTTLQGLIRMDKPIPINANHKCFESDALNHRGWAEIYAVKTEQTGNNPHWYKCDIDVKYLTHNLNTRFKIDKGEKVSDYPIPSLMSEVHPSGTKLDNDEESYFNVDTDGTYYYAEDYTNEDDEVVTFEDGERNNFSIDNGQHIRITSNNPLPTVSDIAFAWSSVLIEEEDENSVSRVIRLLDKKNDRPVFEYQYDDLSIGTDEVTGSVIYRKLNSNGVLESYPIGRDITFRYNPSDVVLDDDFDVETDTEIENVVETGEANFGSTFHLLLNNNTLSFVDEGFNGREINVEDIKLDDGEYYYQVEWINNNEDFETQTIETVFDFIVRDTILTTTYSDKFANLVVSPFPVSDKKILFTREAEEGTIYYYYDDKEEFSYLVEPYYQYQNGTDLITSDGISIFSLDYGYEIVYIQNGLVRLGFNRLTGEMYLGKYDVKSDSYITVYRLHLEKFDDVNLNMISDDKIEVQASDSVFTIYRGHPYIKIKHELEDIYIDTVSNRVWGEKVGDGGSDTPCYWDLMNNANLLDACVGGGQGLKSSCVTTESVDVSDRNLTSLSWSSFPSNILIDTETTFTLTGTSLSSYVDEIDLDDNTCCFGDYTYSIESNGLPHHFDNLISTKSIIQVGETTELTARVLDIDNNPVGANVRVDFYDEYTPIIGLTSDKDIIQTGEVANLSVKVRDSDGSNVGSGIRVDFYVDI